MRVARCGAELGDGVHGDVGGGRIATRSEHHARVLKHAVSRARGRPPGHRPKEVLDWSECEADQRHAEIIARELGLGEESEGVLPPGVSETDKASKMRGGDGKFCREIVQSVRREGELPGARQTGHPVRGEGVSAKPEAKDGTRAKRLGRFLGDSKVCVLKFELQKMPSREVAWSDSEFAGRKRTRRSTSGRVVFFLRSLFEDVQERARRYRLIFMRV